MRIFRFLRRQLNYYVVPFLNVLYTGGVKFINVNIQGRRIFFLLLIILTLTTSLDLQMLCKMAVGFDCQI